MGTGPLGPGGDAVDRHIDPVFGRVLHIGAGLGSVPRRCHLYGWAVRRGHQRSHRTRPLWRRSTGAKPGFHQRIAVVGVIFDGGDWGQYFGDPGLFAAIAVSTAAAGRLLWDQRLSFGP